MFQPLNREKVYNRLVTPLKAPPSALSRHISKSAETLVATTRCGKEIKSRKARSTEQPGSGGLPPLAHNWPDDLSLRSRSRNGSGSSRAGSVDRSTRGSTTTLNSDEDNINVVVRVRPVSDQERSHGEREVLEFPGKGQVIDLLNPGTAKKPLQVRWSKESRSFYVENLFTVDCEELDDLFAVLEEGTRNRAVGSHSMNAHSSRSHTVLSVRVRRDVRSERDVTCSTHGKINFVDLAGSEMTKRTHSTGKTLEEANNINKSLMVLGYCIAQLSDGRKKGHIPYRDSKLTKLLADSLAGNGVTLMIACIAPTRANLSESVNTLRYAARAKKIKSKPIVKIDARDALILSLKREVELLQAENQHLRTALHVHIDYNVDPLADERDMTPRIESNQLHQLGQSELVRLVQLHMAESAALRRENRDLFAARDLLLRDHELVTRENERLLKKLEDVNSVCVRSPIIPARPTYSETSTKEPDVWTKQPQPSAPK
ncbi:Kinesin-like protein KIF12 [Papilio machaon]|uniref:Kinesin-like protein n=1 Tax=Papilio machaon TaxID=76193 RepID=A0A0N1ID17_PAPMA|nr:Kinesin-like protein KIF12 [Papilio machaon]